MMLPNKSWISLGRFPFFPDKSDVHCHGFKGVLCKGQFMGQLYCSFGLHSRILGNKNSGWVWPTGDIGGRITPWNLPFVGSFSNSSIRSFIYFVTSPTLIKSNPVVPWYVNICSTNQRISIFLQMRFIPVEKSRMIKKRVPKIKKYIYLWHVLVLLLMPTPALGELRSAKCQLCSIWKSHVNTCLV